MVSLIRDHDNNMIAMAIDNDDNYNDAGEYTHDKLNLYHIYI